MGAKSRGNFPVGMCLPTCKCMLHRKSKPPVYNMITSYKFDPDFLNKKLKKYLRDLKCHLKNMGFVTDHDQLLMHRVEAIPSEDYILVNCSCGELERYDGPADREKTCGLMIDFYKRHLKELGFPGYQ